MRQVNTGAVLYRKIDKTVYEINVMQSDNAKESAEDILVRLIANDIVNIGLHFILKNVRPYAAPCSEA